MENHGKQLPGYPTLRGKGSYRLDEAKARIAELEEALRPFANQAHEGRDYERARKVLDHG